MVAHLWKVVLSDLTAYAPIEWTIYVVTSDAISAGQLALACGDDEETPEIKSIEYVDGAVFLDPRCDATKNDRIVSMKGSE